jgi:predicted kinase
MLIMMAGLPGVGKSTVAKEIARALSAPVVAVDLIEAAMWRAGMERSQPAGLAAYVVAEAIAEGVLALGQRVIVDAVNAVEPARNQWRFLAARSNVPLRIIEVICSDPDVHRQRLQSRSRGLPPDMEPTWTGVLQRQAAFEPWTDDRLVLDSVEGD